MIACIQCALKAAVDRVTDSSAWSFDETHEEHRARCHPDQEATQRERKELERILLERKPWIYREGRT